MTWRRRRLPGWSVGVARYRTMRGSEVHAVSWRVDLGLWSFSWGRVY